MPSAAPPLATAGALIAPAPPAVSLPLVLLRLQPAAPAVNIAMTMTTMMCLMFDFIVLLLHELRPSAGGLRDESAAVGEQWTCKDTAVVWVIHLLSTSIFWVRRRRVDYIGAILVPIGITANGTAQVPVYNLQPSCKN
jgi:hypothetical protein